MRLNEIGQRGDLDAELANDSDRFATWSDSSIRVTHSLQLRAIGGLERLLALLLTSDRS
jgi:hypothetical protein